MTSSFNADCDPGRGLAAWLTLGAAGRAIARMPLRPFLLIPALGLALALAGCASNSARIDRAAKAAGLSRSVVSGTAYRHVVYRNDLANASAGRRDSSPVSSARRLYVFIDGDGRPWSRDGQQPEEDPTTHNPLALKLLAQTPGAAIYVSRPCYQQIVDPGCSSESWTSGRYSTATIASIAAVARDAVVSGGFDSIAMIGYSGGGVLAVLVAEQLEHVAAVVTIAANLDTDAWTTYHHYLPLSGSLNPAKSNGLHQWREIHLVGANDVVVPAITTTTYFAKYPAAVQRPYAGFDHVCCWVEQWPAIFAEVQKQLEQ